MHDLDEDHEHPEFAAIGPDTVMEDIEGLEMFTLKSVGIDIGSSTSHLVFSQLIVEYFAQYAGKFICAAAGHNHEALLAAYGSGAVDLSQNERKTVLNVDMGGGT